jgi:glycosyltransferase involved in cell wall biosynthesis
MVAWSEYRKMLWYERRCLASADHVFAVSENDRETFSTFIDRKHISVIPTGVDTEHFRPDWSTARTNELVFTGAMDWMPNEDAILYFVREILPLIREDIPQATLTVAGRSPSSRLFALAAADTRIRITGRVEDIRPYVSAGSVFVVPLRIGGGTRLKIFEAMAMGKAIVSTSIGAEGLPVTHGKDIVIADTPKSFARSVVELLHQPEQRKSLGLSARQFVETKSSWRAVSELFDDLLGRVSELPSLRNVV